MGARMVAFLESLSGLDCLDCLAEKGKPESKRHKLETPQLMTLSWKQAEMSVTGVLYFLRPRSGEARAPAPGAIR